MFSAADLKFEHPAWSIAQTPAGLELQYRNWRGKGSHWALGALAVWFSFCLWGISGFIKNWFIDWAEILPAGVVLFLILLGGCWLGFFLAGNLYERCVYVLSGSIFTHERYRIDRPMQKTLIEKSRIEKIYKLYTPPKTAKSSATWRTLITFIDAQGKKRDRALDGHSEEEADFLTGLFCSWSGVEISKENTSA